MMFGAPVQIGGYCPACEVYGPKDEPCWCCDGNVEIRSVPTGGHRYNPSAQLDAYMQWWCISPNPEPIDP